MPSLLRTVIIDSDDQCRASTRRLLAEIPSLHLVAEYRDLSQALLTLATHQVDVVFVEVGPDTTSIEGLVRAVPEAAVLAMGPVTSADFVIQAIRAGALEFLRRPVERAEVVGALDKVLRVRRGSPLQRPVARVTSVYATKGGLGATTLAVNLAVCLVERPKSRVLLVELHTCPSDVATFLDLRPTYSVRDALENIGRLDESFLQGLLSRHQSGLLVLAGPLRPAGAQLGAEQVRAMIEILRCHFDHVVLDLRHDFDAGTIAALEASDTILFLTGPNIAALRSSAAGLMAFRHLGVDTRKVRAVVMRDGTGNDVTLKDARRALDTPIFWTIPNDYAAVVSAIDQGHPVVKASPRSRIAVSLRRLCDAVETGVPRETTTPKRASLLRLAWSPKGSAGGS
ncbi:MAG TPA: AAA family ATPase [Methylomirabilota bacterium]|nr:AAA family ATPase [Methylomirabilota bacterium]